MLFRLTRSLQTFTFNDSILISRLLKVRVIYNPSEWIRDNLINNYLIKEDNLPGIIFQPSQIVIYHPDKIFEIIAKDMSKLIKEACGNAIKTEFAKSAKGTEGEE